MGFPEAVPNPAMLYAYAHQIDPMIRGLRAYHRSIIDPRTGQVIKRPPLIAVQRVHDYSVEVVDLTGDIIGLCSQG